MAVVEHEHVWRPPSGKGPVFPASVEACACGETRNSSWPVRWLVENGKSVSAVGATVAEMLHDLYAGIYHVENVLDSSFAGSYVQVELGGSGMATYDWDHLTRLVVLAHDHCVRVELNAKIKIGKYEGTPYEYAALVATFSPRVRDDRPDAYPYHRHPTMEQAIVTARTKRSIA